MTTVNVASGLEVDVEVGDYLRVVDDKGETISEVVAADGLENTLKLLHPERPFPMRVNAADLHAVEVIRRRRDG